MVQHLIRFYIDIPIYKCMCGVRVGGSRDAACELAAKWWPGNDWADNQAPSQQVATAFLPDDAAGALLWFERVPPTPIIAHECAHAALHILRHRGVAINDASEESFTYLLEFLVEQVLSGIRKFKPRRRH